MKVNRMRRLRDAPSNIRGALFHFTRYIKSIKKFLAHIPFYLIGVIDRGLFFKKTEVEAPITQLGIDVKDIHSEGFAEGVLATDFPDEARPEVFTRSTAILNGGLSLDDAYANWILPLGSTLRSRLVDMTLRIETVRTHGMLHTPPYDLAESGEDGLSRRRSARIMLNGNLVDKIYLVARHPHGEDFGVDSRRSIPVFRYVNFSERDQVLRLEVDRMVAWDIDRVILEPVIVAKHLRPWAGMVVGSLISALVSGTISLLSMAF